MTRRIAFATLCLVLLALSALPAFALPRDCDDRCQPSTPDTIVCACPWSFEVTTCGAWNENMCGLLFAPLPSDIGLPNTLLTELGINIYG